MRLKHYFTLLLLLFCLCALKLEAQTGRWRGNIELPNNAGLGVIFNISEVENGKLIAKMDVPMQGAANITASDLIVSGDSIKFKVPSILGKYMGRFISEDSISGKWNQGGQSFILNLSKTGDVKEASRPQTPNPPYPYISKEVVYTNPRSGFKLAGTLTLPQEADKCPAVILITGSGAQDRDETLMGHKPFLVIADYFTRNGIAVLRVDDRGVGGSEGNINDVSSHDFATDVLAGLEFLKTQNKIDKNNIGLVGHSEGGIIAPLAAVESKEVAFIVMMAGVGIPGDSLLLEQTRLIARAMGMPEQTINAQLFVTKGIINVLKKEKDPDRRTESLRNMVTGGMYEQMDRERQQMIDAQMAQYDNNWFSFLVSFDPRPYLEKVKCPVLALNGEKDLQVPPKLNLPAIEAALSKGGNKNHKTIELEDLNHLFQKCETGAPAEYGQIEETISPEVLEIMKNWILEISL